MLYRLKIALVAGLVCVCSPLYAKAEDYLGLSYKYRSIHGHNTDSYDTRLILPNDYKGGEVFFAHRFINDVGVHIGYEQSQNTVCTHVFTTGQQFLGPPQNAGDVSVTNTSIKALQLNMVGYVELFKKIELVGQFGFSLMHADMLATLTSAGIVHNLAPGKNIKCIPTLSLGVQYFILNSRYGIRVLGDWEGTNLYRFNMTDMDGVRYTIRPFKQSWCFTAGAVVRF